MIIAILLMIIGLMMLILGAEALVYGSVSLAKKLGVPSLIIGLTVVAVGTSAPELLVNIFSALKGKADIGVGNIIGSNIANILLILGLSAAIVPIKVQSSVVRREIPFALFAMILLFIMGNDGFLGDSKFNIFTRTDGLILMSIFAVFMYYTIMMAKTHPKESLNNIKTYSYPLSFIGISAGLILLFFGGKVLVDQAVILARIAGLSEALIGLTIIAVGTSLPELATSIAAVVRRHQDLAVGNIIGSNIFNVFWVLGLTSMISPVLFNTRLNVDVIVGVVATFLLFLFIFTGVRRNTIGRAAGLVFVFFYILYVIYLIQRG